MLSTKKKFNKYDTFLFLLIGSLVSGNLFGAFQLPRVLAILFLVPSMQNYHKVKRLIAPMAGVLFAFLVYSLFSCLWTPASKAESLLETGYNVIHVIMFFEIVILSSIAKNPIKTIFGGFLVTFIISAFIASWELFTDNHLYTSSAEGDRYSKSAEGVYLRYFAAVTFHNFNTYTTFICLLLPFLFYGISNKSYNSKYKLLFIVVVIAAMIIILYNASRGGFLALVMMVVIYYSFILKSKTGAKSYLLLISLLLFIILTYYGYAILNTLIMRGSFQGAIENEGRFSIWSNVLKCTEDYFFIGCGAGGIGNAMIHYAKGGILAPHNLFLEILSQYGLFFFISYIVFLFNIFKRARLVNDQSRKICLYQALIAFPVVTIINSIYMKSPILWVSMASLYVFANYERIKFIHKSVRHTA